MSVFTLSDDLLQNIEQKTHYCDILFVFVQTNPFKVAIDRSNKILDVYSELAQSNNSIKTWLDLLSYEPTSFEKINVEILDNLTSKELFLKVCSATVNQKKLLIYSHQNWSDYQYASNNTVMYSGCSIDMIDRDEAIMALKISSTNIVAVNSVVATESSQISSSRNINK